MSDTSTDDEYDYDDVIHDDRAVDHDLVRRDDFEALDRALNHHDHSSDFDIFNAVLDAARRLVDGATQRDDAAAVNAALHLPLGPLGGESDRPGAVGGEAVPDSPDRLPRNE